MIHLLECPITREPDNFDSRCTCEVDGVVARCVECRKEFSRIEINAANSCPNCGSEGIPMSPLEDVTLKINWHELRILSIWAEFWANEKDSDGTKRMNVTIKAITDALEAQYPSYIPLMLGKELGQVKEQFGEIEISDGLKVIDVEPGKKMH